MEGQFSTAEHHYTEGGDWKAAVNMYRSNELWEDAYRVSLVMMKISTQIALKD